VDKSLLDTDVLSEIMKAKDAQVVATAVAYESLYGKLTTSVITVMEIVKGLHKAGQAAAMNRFLAGIQSSEVLPFDQSCAEIAGKVFGDLERAGQPIGRADVMIAAIAITHELTLATGNRRHYERIQALGYPLRLVNWREPMA
jgi:tRNA(fMet)-specific endonuclease VapC